MKISELLGEAYTLGMKIPDTKVDIKGTIAHLLAGYKKVAKVAEDVDLCFNEKPEGRYYFLMLDNDEVIAWAKVSTKDILNKTYDHLDFVYVVPSHRGSNAIKILLHSLKEETPRQLIDDGVLFLDGQRIMNKFLVNDSIFKVQVLNKITGKITPFTELLNDPEKCYILKEDKQGYGKQFMPLPLMEFCWYYSLYDQ